MVFLIVAAVTFVIGLNLFSYLSSQVSISVNAISRFNLLTYDFLAVIRLHYY